jgi:hypothetical protein
MQNKTRMLVGALLCVCAMPPFAAHAQLVGTDNVPGTACSAKGSVQMTANAAGPGAYILTCDGDAPTGKWVATINAELPTANAQVANKEYVDSAVAAGSLAVCTNDYASLCALETNRGGNDPQFTAANIASGVNILGVTGTLTGGLTGPSGCANIGDLCADGTVFAGYHPITHIHLFIPPTDQGTTSQWKTATGANDIATDSFHDGLANSNQVANSTTFPAFKLCKDLPLAGKRWYLPSRVELDYLYNNRAILVAGGNITDFQNAYYWSSTEYGTNYAWRQGFPDGFIYVSDKTVSFRVRCVGR